MTTEFLHPPQNFKPEGHPVTPFMRARQEWDDRIGSTVVQTRNWRVAFMVSSLMSFGLLMCLGYQLTQHTVIPIIVGLDRDRGEPVVLGRADKQPYEPQLQEIKYFLANFLTLVRSVPSDPVLIRQNWLTAYQFLRSEAANTLNDSANQDLKNPLHRIGKDTLTIQPTSIVQVAGSNSYQARWEETVYNAQGVRSEHYTMNGIFTIEIEPPKDENSLSVNPLGIFITHFQWNRELEEK